jgi:hypothetical protein
MAKNDKHGISLIVTQSLVGEDEGGGIYVVHPHPRPPPSRGRIDTYIFIVRGWRTRHSPTQETTALAVEVCVTPVESKTTLHQSRFGGFRSLADDPPKPWHRWVWLLGTIGLPGGLHEKFNRKEGSKYGVRRTWFGQILGSCE